MAGGTNESTPPAVDFFVDYTNANYALTTAAGNPCAGRPRTKRTWARSVRGLPVVNAAKSWTFFN